VRRQKKLKLDSILYILREVAHCRMLKKTLLAGCSKPLRYKAPEIPACGRQAEE
jgi:hypothetical protein